MSPEGLPVDDVARSRGESESVEEGLVCTIAADAVGDHRNPPRQRQTSLPICGRRWLPGLFAYIREKTQAESNVPSQTEAVCRRRLAFKHWSYPAISPRVRTLSWTRGWGKKGGKSLFLGPHQHAPLGRPPRTFRGLRFSAPYKPCVFGKLMFVYFGLILANRKASVRFTEPVSM